MAVLKNDCTRSGLCGSMIAIGVAMFLVDTFSSFAFREWSMAAPDGPSVILASSIELSDLASEEADAFADANPEREEVEVGYSSVGPRLDSGVSRLPAASAT
ncbi:hypothetical protein V7S43_016869 [Phytophthora oleae]|uniref:Uncharacterized protein n=1 Tax=Phytophthora oleae TaxID=2107226 RepID=A0ABD3EY32_9STRA